MITLKFTVCTIKSSRQAIAKLQLKTSVLRGPVSNLIECMRNIRFADCDKDSKITARLQDFKDLKKIIGIMCIDWGLWDYTIRITVKTVRDCKV